MKSPRVLSIVWNLIRGGTEGQCARVAMELGRRGHVHRVAAFRREGLFLQPVESICGPVYAMGIHGLLEWRTADAIRRLRRYLREERIDLVHTWDADAAIFGSLTARLAGVPWITSRRDLGEIYPPWKLRLMRWADLGARAVVVNADAIANTAARHVPRDRVRRIPNVLDLAEFDHRAREGYHGAHRLPTGPLVVHLARLDPEKDLDTYLRAARIVVDAQPDVHFLVAGDGRERARLESLADELGVRPRVVFLGEVADVPGLLKRCSVGALLPKRNEGLSNTILEYMAAGLPVVATDCGGNRELVRDGDSGCVVPSGDPQAAAAVLLGLLRDPARATALGREGRSRVEREHALGAVVDQFEALYETAAAATTTASPRP